jgi:hypothetical protein
MQVGEPEEEPRAAEDQTLSSATLSAPPEDDQDATQKEIDPTKEEDGLTNVEITGVVNLIFRLSITVGLTQLLYY